METWRFGSFGVEVDSGRRIRRGLRLALMAACTSQLEPPNSTVTRSPTLSTRIWLAGYIVNSLNTELTIQTTQLGLAFSNNLNAQLLAGWLTGRLAQLLHCEQLSQHRTDYPNYPIGPSATSNHPLGRQQGRQKGHQDPYNVGSGKNPASWQGPSPTPTDLTRFDISPLDKIESLPIPVPKRPTRFVGVISTEG
jgi:hypothetical protein